LTRHKTNVFLDDQALELLNWWKVQCKREWQDHGSFSCVAYAYTFNIAMLSLALQILSHLNGNC